MKILYIIIAALIVISTGSIIYNQFNQDSKTESNTTGIESKTQSTEIKTNAKLEANQNIKQNGTYVSYSPEILKNAKNPEQKIVLFFHAQWCPFCKTADQAFLNNPSKIPVNTIVLKTDYDTNSELKKKYGVTTQHTFVQIDQQGNKVTAWIGGDIDNLQKNLK